MRSAESQIRKIPSKDRQRIITTLEQIRKDPFAGDIVYLKGQDSALRRRVGDWRILFDIYPEQKLVIVSAILRRTSKTY